MEGEGRGCVRKVAYPIWKKSRVKEAQKKESEGGNVIETEGGRKTENRETANGQ